MHKTWVVVADSSRARIFRRGARWQALDEHQGLVPPQPQLHRGADKTGGHAGPHENGNRNVHAAGDAATSNQKHAEGFARDIADTLHAGRSRGDFEKLVLVAPPAFLGRLRHNLNRTTAQCVTQEVDKNWSRHACRDIEGLLARHF